MMRLLQTSHLLARCIATFNLALIILSPYLRPFYVMLRRNRLVNVLLLWLFFSSIALVFHLANDILQMSRQPRRMQRYHFIVDLLFSLAWFGTIAFNVLRHLPIVMFFAG